MFALFRSIYSHFFPLFCYVSLVPDLTSPRPRFHVPTSPISRLPSPISRPHASQVPKHTSPRPCPTHSHFDNDILTSKPPFFFLFLMSHSTMLIKFEIKVLTNVLRLHIKHFSWNKEETSCVISVYARLFWIFITVKREIP